MTRKTFALFDPELAVSAMLDACHKFNPAVQWRNPVMFVVYVASLLTTVLWLHALTGQGEAPAGFVLAVALWLWFTVLFANFAEALAEGRSKAQAASLRGLKKETWSRKLYAPRVDAQWKMTPAGDLRKGDVVLVAAQEVIPADGEVIEGVASVDESAITGESAPVIREAGGDFSSVTGGTRVLSDWIVVRVTANPGETFVDRMIAMVENAKRQKTPNEIALTILLVALTIVFLGVTVTLLPFSLFGVDVAQAGTPVTITGLVALLVCLIPTTIAGLLSAIGVAGMSRMMQSSPPPAAPSKRRATSTCCCSTRPARSPWATARHRTSCPPTASARPNWAMPRSSPRSPTRRPRGAASWCWPSSASSCASATSTRSARASCTSRRRRA